MSILILDGLNRRKLRLTMANPRFEISNKGLTLILCVVFFRKDNKMALVQLDSVESAMEALIVSFVALADVIKMDM